MPDILFYERQHLEKLIQQESSLKYIFDEFVRNIGFHMSGWKDTGREDVWFRNSKIEEEVEKELKTLHDKLIDNIQNYSIDAWNRSNKKYDDIVQGYINNLSIKDVAERGVFSRNKEALNSFLKKKIEGKTLSDRVWNVVGTGKENIEYYISSGIATGRSANSISQDLRQLLKEPDKRFRRIRNAKGKLVMSAPMKDYEPGSGVYRSSFMNAKRLAATETNMAYRTADNERWQKLDFVLGVEIKRSNSNKGPCPICDALVGRYPKDYVFIGWHPWCICYATPILMEEDDFINFLDDENVSTDKYIDDIPVNARDYLVDKLQKGKISIDSYLLKDNKRFFPEFIKEDT